jgi:amino acid adenylation domain-containing protein
LFEQLSPGTHVHHLPLQIHIAGELDVPILEIALQRVVDRHEALRTEIRSSDGLPAQVVRPTPRTRLDPTDLTGRSPVACDAELRRIMSEELRRPFDLSEGPLFRIALFRCRASEHVLQIVAHQIVADAHSLELLIHELATTYGALARGEEPDVPPLPLQYRAHASKELEFLDSPGHEEELAHWRSKLGGGTRPIEVPLDHPRPPIQTFDGREEAIEIGEALVAKLGALVGPEATLSVVLLAAYFVLLHRNTGETDIAVGTPITQRARAETLGLIGPFSNTLVIRADLADLPTFRALIDRVLEVLLEAFDHQALSFAEIIGDLQPVRDLSRSPLFQVMFDPTRFRMRPVAADRVTFTPREVSPESSPHDLTLLVNERDRPIHVKLEYNVALYEPDTAVRLLRQYRTILESIAENPDTAIDRIPILSREEKSQLVTGWNRTAAGHPDRPLAHEEVFLRAAATPNARAVAMRGSELGYRDLVERVHQLARELIARGVTKGDRVALEMERGFDMVVALLAVLESGGAYVPLDPTHPLDRNAFILADAAPRVVLTDGDRIGRVVGHTFDVLDVRDRAAASPEPCGPIAAPDDLAYVIYTSGSTGQPKGVEITHRSLSNFLHAMRAAPGVRGSDRLLAVTTLAFDIAALELLLPLVTGASVEIADAKATRDPDALIERIEEGRASIMQATPATWRMLIDAGWKGSRNLKVLCGGEPLPRDLADALLERSASVWNMYGPTETTIWSTIHAVRYGGHVVPIGEPIDNTTAYVVDARMEPVPIGVTGELLIGGPGVARGYRGRPGLTAERFVPDPFVPGARVYRTGDLARRLPTGELVCLGRTDFQVKIRGFRIELAEVEAALRAHADVREAAVIAKDEGGERRLVALLEVRRRIDPAELRAHLEAMLPSYMIPSRFVSLEALPRLPNGKLDRKALPALDAASGPPSEPPRGPVEETMAKVFAELVGSNHVGRFDSFFDLGGNSISAVRLVNRLEKTLGVRVPLGTVFQSPTIADLARLVVVDAPIAGAGKEPAVIRLADGPGGPPLFCICGIHLYKELSGHVRDRSVYGVFIPIEERILAGEAQAITVERMAADYIGAIREAQPRGPYALTGVSFGGVLAFEVARQLRRQGEAIAFLGVLDSMLPRAMVRHPIRWLEAQVSDPKKLAKGAASLLDRVRRREARPSTREEIYDRATAIYDRQDHLYEGSVVLVRARDAVVGEGWVVDSCFGWDDLVRGGLHVYAIPGGHLGILAEPHVKELAETLAIHLGAVLPNRP